MLRLGDISLDVESQAAFGRWRGGAGGSVSEQTLGQGSDRPGACTGCAQECCQRDGDFTKRTDSIRVDAVVLICAW
jgi:hypothetical protein